ncbi:MAG: hypothetical protein JEZ03_06585 [Bacteroidales bacterium]|nr:hypothetical protein [Bacteroidales bacterium]
MRTTTLPRQLFRTSIFLLSGLLVALFIYTIDEGRQGFTGILEKQSLIEMGLYSISYTLIGLLIFKYLKRVVESIPAFILSAVASVPGGFAVYLLILFIISLILK